MKKVGGNINAEFQSFSTIRNEIGEEIQQWATVAQHKGWLDLSSGNSSYKSFNAKTEEATHVFVCDRFDIDKVSIGRLVIKGKTFDVTYFDEPMELGYHFEIFLKELNQNEQ